MVFILLLMHPTEPVVDEKRSSPDQEPTGAIDENKSIIDRKIDQ
jgi:hypothetical protein